MWLYEVLLHIFQSFYFCWNWRDGGRKKGRKDSLQNQTQFQRNGKKRSKRENSDETKWMRGELLAKGTYNAQAARRKHLFQFSGLRGTMKCSRGGKIVKFFPARNFSQYIQKLTTLRILVWIYWRSFVHEIFSKRKSTIAHMW